MFAMGAKPKGASPPSVPATPAAPWPASVPNTPRLRDAPALQSRPDADRAAKSKDHDPSAPEHRPFQLLLDVSLDAPIVVLPLNSHSPDHLEIDLGTLLVHNRIGWEQRGILGGVECAAAAPKAAAAAAGKEAEARQQRVLMDDMTVGSGSGGSVGCLGCVGRGCTASREWRPPPLFLPQSCRTLSLI
jgi:hypothetical protein